MTLHNKLTRENAEKIMESSKKFPHINNSLKILNKCFDMYNSDEIFVSFNGGKDCTAVLHLAASVALLRNFSSLTCLYVIGDTFPEVDDFVEKAAQYYNIKLIKMKKPIKAALNELLLVDNNLKACLMGVRKGDPGTDCVESFMNTDPGWPKLMRVNLILDWTYNQVWEFLLKHNVPYCSLYDKGYTSLGDKNNTFPNELLKNPNDPLQYLPAYKLVDDSTERNGRG
ncbi:hypothetical protein HCN44_000610 [Aphidius gifuensis]|uniref:FAD synthase n=1 Tax=Aphidius gifuensis TaxID=684658 RepID=A0A834XS50_APHGI|nr:probable FAD synthase [Aphidius gifuensis]KAF7990805.1 hypothetical protein HCN44_000610 [Aphidius gifuensis]